MILLIKASIVVICLLAFYKVLLERESFFAVNRFYLLSCLALALILPLTVLPKLIDHQGFVENWFQRPADNLIKADTGDDNLIENKDVFDTSRHFQEHLGSEYVTSPESGSAAAAGQSTVVLASTRTLSALDWLWYVYLFGVIILSINLIAQVFSTIWKAWKSDDKIISDEGIIVNLSGESEPCSFFNYIFINPASYDYDTYEQIIAHEKIHVERGHSWDLLFSELAVILLWFNPFVWILRREVEKNIEYQTDDILVNKKREEKKVYQMNLVKIASYTRPLAITTNYNQSLIKQRILKMNAKRSHKFNYWKYAFLLPVLFFLAMGLNSPAVSAAKASTVETMEESIADDTLVVRQMADEKVKDIKQEESKQQLETPKRSSLERIPVKEYRSHEIENCEEFEAAVAAGDLDRVKEILKTLDPDCLKVKNKKGNNFKKLEQLVEKKKTIIAEEEGVEDETLEPCKAVRKALKSGQYQELRRLLETEDVSCLNDVYGDPSKDIDLLQGLLRYGAKLDVDHNDVMHISQIGFVIDGYDYKKPSCQDPNFLLLADAIRRRDVGAIKGILSTEDLTCPLGTDGVTNDFLFIKELMKYQPNIQFIGQDKIQVGGIGIDIDLDKKLDKPKYIEGGELGRDIEEVESFMAESKTPKYELTCLNLIEALLSHDRKSAKRMASQLNLNNCFHKVTETHSYEGDVLTHSIVYTPLIVAAGDGDLEMAKVLVKYGADVNYRGSGSLTPLMWAVDAGNEYLVRYLLESGANINSTNEKGYTALDHARFSSNKRIIDYLLSRGAVGK